MIPSRLVAFLAGSLFALGLSVGGMTRTSKVRGFLDFAGQWDPSLVFVMAGAVGVYFVIHRLVIKRPSPLYDRHFHLPGRKGIDTRLVAGAALFGIGWGLVGYCPGPALTSLGTGSIVPLVFVAAMATGMAIQRALDAIRRPRAEPDFVVTRNLQRPS